MTSSIFVHIDNYILGQLSIFEKLLFIVYNHTDFLRHTQGTYFNVPTMYIGLTNAS